MWYQQISRFWYSLRLELRGRPLLFRWKGDRLLGRLRRFSCRSAIYFWRAAIAFIQGSSLFSGVCIWYIPFSTLAKILSAESASWSRDKHLIDGARICIIIAGSLSVQKPRRIGSVMVCIPSVAFIWRKSWDGVLSPLVKFRKSAWSESSSERPVRLSITSLRCVYDSCSGTNSRMSATSSTIEGGNAENRAANLVSWDAIFRT